ncbi:glycosyltransferase family 4 protein [Geobacter pelophilus]|uniref:Glycosyltransferase family 4 protein n=1 Tax=Geoanaerobacter pelophilus TaxID=60036 RepID=A0AAW4L2G5_9BACT|nr:glycosyltransferase family 4 protein [Geoanaerobacter pelophilus]MBT0663717.1 glycosyltransferase family 4 protein [Geoanaerobacter pelophilus]
MNIIVTTHDSIHPIKGGGALRTLKTAEEFRRRGHNVIIIAPTDGAAEVNGIKIEWLRGPSKQRSQILSSIKFNVRLLIKYLKFIRWADLIFVHNTIAAAVMLFLKPVFRCRFALDITDIHAEYLSIGRRTIMETLATPLLLFIEYRIIRIAESITAASLAMKRVLVEHGVRPDRIEVVYDGAEIDRLSAEKSDDFYFNLIHLGLIDKQHGVDVLIKALPEVLKEFPLVKCFIVGDGRELTKIKSLALELGVFDNCVFTGQLPCQEARAYLQKANIGIIPRRDNLPNRIVTTLKLLEYWASGTGVISSRLEAITEVGMEGLNITYFEPGSPSALALQIKRLLSAPEKLDLLRANGIKAAHHYCWDLLAPQIADKAVEL